MISTFEHPTPDVRRCLDIGDEILAAVVDEGRREGVFAYAVFAADGRCWFQKEDRKTGMVSKKFSPRVAAMMRENREALKVWARWLDELERMNRK